MSLIAETLGKGFKSMLSAGFKNIVNDFTHQHPEGVKSWLQSEVGQAWEKGVDFVNEPEVQ